MSKSPLCWFETGTVSEMKNVISTTPGQIRYLINRRFEVVNALSPRETKSISGREIFSDIWVPKTIGIVTSIIFDSMNGWCVNIEYEGPIEPEFLKIDEFYVDVPIENFLPNTRPLDPQQEPSSPYFKSTAANDEQY